MYEIGDEFVSYYTDPPIDKLNQYKIDQIIDIQDRDTKVLLAKARVKKTDTHMIVSEIIEVFDSGGNHGKSLQAI